MFGQVLNAGEIRRFWSQMLIRQGFFESGILEKLGRECGTPLLGTSISQRRVLVGNFEGKLFCGHFLYVLSPRRGINSKINKNLLLSKVVACQEKEKTNGGYKQNK